MGVVIAGIWWKLPASSTAAALARRYARQQLGEWGLDGKADDVLLVVSELVANAARASTADLSDPAHLALRLSRQATRITIEVWDGSPGRPLVTHARNDAENGRGLHIVDVLSLTWGTRWPAEGGKIVWSEVRLD
ncbi:hypothetical protein Sru01_09680 [Sphaerisporangium rufum]|uniref:Histidine kinase/HSP90-like ATPase domain-containing protein n=1 Tax=Sphaerisporangium rufum TaxID=1381558 RepID=A0A919UWF9_9ACTN|nr:ATP-binding protein [Sphaerisporangium rufum]GII75986.1 hypothetical protein Sru01_09680 [Sphaerisporangium rufum]